MSFKAQQWAYRQDLPAAAKSVLCALAFHLNPVDGRLFPSAKTLAADTGLHKRTVQRMLSTLTTRGLIKITPGWWRGGRPVNNYTLIFDGSDPKR